MTSNAQAPDGRPNRDIVAEMLAPQYLQSMRSLDDDTLVAHRYASFMEESDLSYIRRTLQGRLDLLGFETTRRAQQPRDTDEGPHFGNDQELARALAQILTAKNPNGSPLAGIPQQGGAASPVPSMTAADIDERRASAKAAVDDLKVSDVRNLSDADLADATARLVALEFDLSQARTRMQVIADAVAEEVTRRVRNGSLTPTILD